jgi:hypothetical protein
VCRSIRLTNFGIESFELAPAGITASCAISTGIMSGAHGVIKPDPQIYQMLEDDCGIPPDRLIFADDRAENIARHNRAAGAGICSTGRKAGPTGWWRKDLLTQGGGSMTIPMIGFQEGEALLDWIGLTEALAAGPPPAPGRDRGHLPLSRKGHAFVRAAWIDGLGGGQDRDRLSRQPRAAACRR